MSATLRAKDVMDTNVVTVGPEFTLSQAYSTLRNAQVSGAPVVCARDGLVGVISQSDLISEAFASELMRVPKDNYFIDARYLDQELGADLHRRLEHTPVRRIMHTDVITVSPTDSLASVAAKMVERNVHRVIVTEGSQVVGIISALGLLRVLFNRD